MTTNEIALRAGVSATAIRLRRRAYPNASEAILCLNTRDFQNLMRVTEKTKKIHKANLYTTADGVDVNLLELADAVGITADAMRRRAKKGSVTLAELMMPPDYERRTFYITGPAGRRMTIRDIEDETGISRSVLQKRVEENRNISYEELTASPRKYSKKTPTEQKDDGGEYEDYTMTEIVQWWRDRGRYIANPLEILCDMLRLRKKNDALPILNHLKGTC